jgi:rhodanese-related sulfurtransferase
MRDNTRKHIECGTARVGRLVVLAAVGLVMLAATNPPCPIQDGVTWETAPTTAEISTSEMERILEAGSALVLDARPREEFAVSHIPGAKCVAPRAGLRMSQYTSDVAEIEKLTKGDKSRPIVLYCNGPFCGKSKRLAADLLAARYTNVRRYQLGMPVWLALGHVAEAEGNAIWSSIEKDKTAVVVDTRGASTFHTGSLPGAKNIPLDEVTDAKDDGRLPMLDHNTRIFVIGKDAGEARAVAQAIARNAFHNVAFYPRPAQDLFRAGLSAEQAQDLESR